MKTIKKAKSGAKFDLNKDGKTTFKDVLIGRGVLPKKAQTGTVVKKFKTESEAAAAGYKKDTTGKWSKSIKPKAKSGASMKKCKYGCK